MKAVLGICLMGSVGACLGQSLETCPHTEIYQRATNEFAQALFYKPKEPKTNDLAFSLAPLILQEVNNPQTAPPFLDQFGTLGVSNGTAILDQSRPAIYWQIDTVQIKGRAFARLSYLWCYAAGPLESKPGQGLGTAVSGPAENVLPMQGIRITLNASGQPAIWEVLADTSRAKLIFVSQNLEAAALAEFGKLLPGRRYAVERSVEAAPDVVVARVIDDSPVASGPIVYLSAGTRAVSTLICRCMSAQVKRLLSSSTYELLPFQAAATNALLVHARMTLQQRAAFWPGDDSDGKQLEASLRLPKAFFAL